MRIIILLLLAGFGLQSNAQQTLKIKITGRDLPLRSSIIVKETGKEYFIDSTGITDISFDKNGNFSLLISSEGFEDKQIKISIPAASGALNVELERDEHELEEVIVQSTRTSRTIANVPTRVETIELEEIDEKNNMRPANVAMLLHESTGIQVQQTSATSANSSIRIQGLDGKYTQLLKDGFANFGNFSSGLSVLEIPPLDLKQVEIIKGPASPLFGGGAIAGVVNFISKTPMRDPEYNFIINHSNIGQSNIGGFASGRKNKTGYTLLALYNRQEAFDVDDDDFSEVPETEEFTIHPKLFFYPDSGLVIIVGNSFTKGERTGGDMTVIKSNPDSFHRYFEKNTTTRNITTLELNRKISTNKQFVLKQSYSFFDREINIPSYNFGGTDRSSFTDISYVSNWGKDALVVGGNILYNKFKEDENANAQRNNNGTTLGIYAQYTLDASNHIKVETGLRMDGVRYRNPLFSNSEIFFLPRISILLNFSPEWSSRIGLGMGYKTPTLFTEQTETMHYQNISQLNNVYSEKSYGGTADINFRKNVSHDLTVSLNNMFFYTYIRDPLILSGNDLSGYYFINADQGVQSLGFETNTKFIFKKHFKLFLGYTYTYAQAQYHVTNKLLPLVPKHKLNSALIYEKEGFLKLGLEGYFTGKQPLGDGSFSPAYEELGFMAEKIFKKFSVYINFENFTDTRQGRYKNVVNGSHTDPSFDEIWTHTEGFVMNGGIKLKF